MANISAIQAQVDSAISRFDSLVAETERRKREQWKAEDAEREREEIDKARRYTERKREHQALYADSYRAFNIEPPMPIDDELPSRYRRRLYDGLRRKLAPNHDLAMVRADELAGSPTAFANFEAMMLDAAGREALHPSDANLPPAGQFVSRERVDRDSGEKRIEWFGKESFIKQLSQEPRRVLRFVGKDGAILFGPPMERVR
jgi:hypothetical protein